MMFKAGVRRYRDPASDISLVELNSHQAFNLVGAPL